MYINSVPGTGPAPNNTCTGSAKTPAQNVASAPTSPALRAGAASAMRRGGRHPQPRAPPLPGPDATTIPAVRNHHLEPAGGPRRWRGGGPGGRNAVLPEPYGYAALAAGAALAARAALSGRRYITTTTSNYGLCSQLTIQIWIISGEKCLKSLENLRHPSFHCSYWKNLT